MNLFVSLIATGLLIGIALIGAYVPAARGVFGIYIPYIAIGVFIVGMIIRIVKWAKIPVPFRITTTAGQQKSLDFIKPNKLDNPSSGIAVLGRMLLEVLLFRSLFRNTRTNIQGGPKITYAENIWLWLFSLLFHWSFLIIFLRHFRFLTDQVPGFVWLMESLDGFFQIGVPSLYLTNILVLAGLLFLLGRRIFSPRMRYISLASDFFPLLLLILIAVTGITMRYFVKTDLVGIKEIAVGLMNFSPVMPAEGINAWFYVHFFSICVLLIYIPMSKLVHMAGVFFSPTRNMANDNRAKRHVNPWQDDKEMFPTHTHTYAEYEDEFRDLMHGCGLPLDKQPEAKEEKK